MMLSQKKKEKQQKIGSQKLSWCLIRSNQPKKNPVSYHIQKKQLLLYADQSLPRLVNRLFMPLPLPFRSSSISSTGVFHYK